ncbi:MAG: tetratricopeptide repeat protein, partial [Planctomycetota bacterium]
MTDTHDPGFYDLFVSYSTKDNFPPDPLASPGEREGWVQVFIKRVRALSADFTGEPLTTTANTEPDWDAFYAPDDIHAGHQWETRLRAAIAHTRVLLACLSEHYWQSAWCRFEWETYLEQESARGLANVEGGITPIYIATAPGVSAQSIIEAAPDWAKTLLTKRQVRLIEFQTHGLDALARIKALRDDPETAKSLQRVADRVSHQIAHARRAERVQQGNLASGTDTFVGRTDELHAIEGQLFGGGALGVITALRGLGGQGKTALALRYGRNLRGRYLGGCWQIIAEGQSELLPLLTTLREPLDLAPIPTEDDPGTARRVLAELHRRAFDPEVARTPGFTTAALLVIDNVDDPQLLSQRQRDALHEAMRQAGLGNDYGWLHVLATTRLEKHELPPALSGHIIPVDALPMSDALALWQRLLAEPGQSLSPTELAAATEIITLLERHTLAVEITARHIRRSFGETAVSHLARLRAALASTPGQTAGALESAQQRETDLPGYTHALAATLRFTFDRLAHEHPAAATVLHYAAHFPAEAVPLPWLRILASLQHPELREESDIPGSLSAWDRAELRLAESLRLLTHADGEHESIARLHRLAGEFLRLSAQQAGEDAARVAAVEGFIEQRCTQAEHDHHYPLAPWERSVLLADLITRMARKDCTTAMAQSGLLLGQILTAYADLGTARRLYVAANAVMQRLAESDPANAAWQRDLSVSFGMLGDLATAQGNLPEAQRLFGESLRIAQRLADSDPPNAQWQYDLGISNERLGDVASAQGDLAKAHTHYSAKRNVIQRLAESDPANAAWQRDLSVSFDKLGNLATAQGNLPEAQRLFGESLRIRQRLAESDPANAAWQRDLSVSFNKLGDLATAQGNLPEAQRLFGEDLRIAQRLAESDPANAEGQRDLWMSFGKLGDLATAQGDLPDAKRRWDDAHRITQRLAESDPANAAWQRDLSVSFNKLGILATAQGNLPEAQRLFGEAHRITQRLAESDPANAAWQRDLSVSFDKLGN